jgi:GNAT superfamily N-acetyltransferase
MKKYRSLFEDKKERPQLEEFIDVFMTKFPSMFVRGLGIVLEVDDCTVSVDLTPFDGRIRISSIMVSEPDRGKGIASKVMKELISLSNELQVELSLLVEPFGRVRTLNRRALSSWYRRLGFKQKGGNKDSLVYEPPIKLSGKFKEEYYSSDLQQHGATFEVFKNPDKGEFMEMKDVSFVYLRGVLVGDDVYVTSEFCTDGESPVVHSDILRVLKEKGVINEYSRALVQDDMIEKYFCFYIEQNNKVTVSGSYSNSFMSGKKIDLSPYLEKIKTRMPWLSYSSSSV